MTLDIIGHLTEVGFTDYEARAYTALVRRNPLTGYELAKVSGVPRPNIYSVIERLQQKGVVQAIGLNGAVKYAPVAPEEVLGKLSKAYGSHIQEASRSLSQIRDLPQGDYVWNLLGYDPILEKATSLIEGAGHRVVLGLWPEELQRLSPSLGRLKARGGEATILCFQGGLHPVDESVGKVYRLSVAGEVRSRWLVLVADEAELLGVEILPDGEAHGAWTRQKLFIAMATWYVRHSIAVAEIVRSLGPRLPRLLDAEALSAIKGASLATMDGKPWLDGLLQAAHK